MLGIPQSSTSSHENIPIIPLPNESAENIDFILSCIYPTTREFPVVKSLERIGILLEMAEKWDFPRAFAILGVNLSDLLGQRQDAMHIWALATRYSLNAVRKAASAHLCSMSEAKSFNPRTEPTVVLKCVDAFDYALLLSEIIREAAKIPDPVRISEGPVAVLAAVMAVSVPAPPVPVALVRVRPFNDYTPNSDMSFADGDIILCSRDDHEFHVHSTILSQASEWFLTEIQSTQPKPDGLRTIQVMEDGAILDWILRSIYPNNVIPALHSLEDISAAFQAAARLHVPRASSVLGTSLMDLMHTEDPLSIWALSAGFQQERPRIAAVRRILRENVVIIPERGMPPASFRRATAYDLGHLLASCTMIRDKGDNIIKGLAVPGRCTSYTRHPIVELPKPTFSEVTDQLGPFSDVAFATAAVYLEICSQCCGKNNCRLVGWSAIKAQYSAKHREIQDLLPTFNP